MTSVVSGNEDEDVGAMRVSDISVSLKMSSALS